MSPAPKPSSPSGTAPEPTPVGAVVVAWLVVGAPLLWGVLQTLKKAAALFQ
ncbi:MAG TPA: hypothetical protein VGI39_40475 [Polyangiaceae bacterium]